MVPANFNQLYYFWIAAREGSLTGAASRLHMTQSNLSHQMRALEASLGRRLLVRSRSGVGLTADGQVLADVCARMFEPARDYLASLRAGLDAPPPPFRLVCGRGVSKNDILAAAETLRRQRRPVRLRIYSGTAQEVAARLQGGLAEAALSNMDLAMKLGREFRSIRLHRKPFYFTAAPALAKIVRRFPSGLQQVALLLRPSDHPVRKQVDAFLSRHGLEPTIAAEVDDPDLIRSMALRGEGVCVLDPEEVAPDLERGRLVLLHRDKIGIEGEVCLITARRAPSHPALRAAIEALIGKK
jgi:LysR family transcriptional activator of nhaA